MFSNLTKVRDEDIVGLNNAKKEYAVFKTLMNGTMRKRILQKFGKTNNARIVNMNSKRIISNALCNCIELRDSSNRNFNKTYLENITNGAVLTTRIISQSLKKHLYYLRNLAGGEFTKSDKEYKHVKRVFIEIYKRFMQYNSFSRRLSDFENRLKLKYESGDEFAMRDSDGKEGKECIMSSSDDDDDSDDDYDVSNDGKECIMSSSDDDDDDVTAECVMRDGDESGDDGDDDDDSEYIVCSGDSDSEYIVCSDDSDSDSDSDSDYYTDDEDDDDSDYDGYSEYIMSSDDDSESDYYTDSDDDDDDDDDDESTECVTSSDGGDSEYVTSSDENDVSSEYE